MSFRYTGLRRAAVWQIAAFACMAICSANAQTANQDVLDVNEAAALLRVKPEIVLSWAETNRIPARRVGVEWRFWRAALL